MTTPDQTELLRRCEDGTATLAELELVRDLLARQETESPLWVGGSALRSALAAEVSSEPAVEVVGILALPDPWAPIAAALAEASEAIPPPGDLAHQVLTATTPEDEARHTALRGALVAAVAAEGGEVDLARQVLRTVEPGLAVPWERLMASLEDGLVQDAAQVDLASAVMGALLPLAEAAAPQAVDALQPALAVLSEELDGLAGAFDVSALVMEAIGAPEAALATEESETSLDSALGVLAGGLAQAARGVEVVPAVLAALEPTLVTSPAEQGLAVAMEALAAGLAAEAVGFDLCDVVMHSLEAAAEEELSAALEALSAGLAAEAVGFDLAGAVMADVLGAPELELMVSAMLDGELDLDARRRLVPALAADPQVRGRMTEWKTLGRDLRASVAAAVSAHPIPSVWAAVASELHLPEPERAPAAQALDVMREGLAVASAGLDISDQVMAAILPPPPRRSEGEAAEPDHAPARGEASWLRRWVWSAPLFGAAMGAAALLALMNVIPSSTVEGDGSPVVQAEVAIQIAAINTTEIEDLTVSGDAMVQVFQFEEGAPMVIFVDEGGNMDGVTL